MFYLKTYSTHFIYGYMASDIWLRTILIVRKEIAKFPINPNCSINRNVKYPVHPDYTINKNNCNKTFIQIMV